MLSCLVPPRFGQEDQITMPSSTAFSLQFPSLASSLHHAEKQHFENASNYHSNTTPSPPISTKSPIGGTVSAVDQHISNAQTQQHYHSYLTQQQQQQQHQEQQRQHHHAMAMAIANMAAANGGVGGGAKSPSTLNGYDEGGRSTSSPGSSTTMGDLCSAHIGPMTGPGGPHACAQCSTAFPTREMLEKHEMMHSPNTTVCCKVCHKTFANVYRLQRHMISHDESVLLRKFKCTECDKAFKFKHHLKEHVRIHSGEKPFACDNCGKRFSHSGSYSSHMTSKKCISMGLKLNNNRSMMKSLEKVAPLGLGMAGSPSNSKRPGGGGGLSQNPMSYFPPGLPNIAGLNNNPVTNSNNNAFYPMIPKYSNYDAMNAALLASLQNPFYSMGLNPRIHPYSITRLLELTAAGNNRLQADPEDMIEEVTEDVVDDQKLVMDLEEQDESKTDKSGRNSPMNGTYDRSSPDQQNNSTHEHQLSKDEAQDRINHDDDDDDEDDCEESSPSPGRESPEIKVEECADEETLQCARCAKKFNHRTELVQHEKVLCGMFNSTEQQRRIDHQQSEPEAINTSYFQSGSEEDPEDRESKAGSEGERKVRVRTALTEEQQSFFKEQYAINPRPTRDEFRMIGLRLNLDPRVVQVWFQNNRSRERKMNTYKPPFTSPVLGQSISPAYSPATAAAAAVPTSNSGAITNNHNANGGEDQPLDLSVKKEIVTPSTSPRYGLAPHQTDSSTPEAINLSRKWSRSPTPFGSARYYNASTPSHRGATSNELSSLIRHTPSPNEAVSRHAAHPNPYVLPPGARSLVPMECLFQMTPEYAEYARSLKLGGLKLGERGTSLSPGSEKRSWRDDESRISHDDEYNFHASKRIKLETSGNSDLDCPFVCDQCDKAFSKQSSLARHKYEHSGQRPYKCEECPKAFKHKHHLTEHKRLHSGEKPFQCTKCLKRFSHSGSYSQHMNHRYSYCKPYRE